MPGHFVVRTSLHCEQRAKHALEARGLNVFLPMVFNARLRCCGEQPLFPSYLFVRDDGNGVALIEGAYGVQQAVRVGGGPGYDGGEPLRVGDDVIARIERYRDAEGDIRLPQLPPSFNGLLTSADGFDLLMRPMRGSMRALAFVMWLIKRCAPVQVRRAA